MLSQLDVVPLALGVSGTPPPADRVLDGRDPLPALTDRAPSPHARLGFAYAATSGLREGPLKIVRPAAAAPWELYDLAADPVESRDLAAARPADLARLVTSFDAWRESMKQDASPRAPWIAPKKAK